MQPQTQSLFPSAQVLHNLDPRASSAASVRSAGWYWTQRCSCCVGTLARVHAMACVTVWMWGRSGGWAASCCARLTSSVGALGTAGLLRRSFQRSFAGVRVICVHMGLLQAVEVRIWVYPVMVHGCSATTGHHHPFALGAVDKNCATPPLSHSASPPHSLITHSAIWTTSFGGWKWSEKDQNVRQRRSESGVSSSSSSAAALRAKYKTPVRETRSFHASFQQHALWLLTRRNPAWQQICH